jgi:hypothetical protein
MLLANLTKTDAAGFYGEVVGRFPTAALAELSLPVDRWQDVEPRIGRIVRLDTGEPPA